MSATRKNEYFEILKSNIAKLGNRPIFFIGSGMTRRYINGPNWEGLLTELINKINLKKPYDYYFQKAEGNYERIANLLETEYFEYAWSNRDKFKSKYFTRDFGKDIFIKERISEIFIKLLDNFSDIDPEMKNEIDLLSKTNPSVIITTNYDRLIEKHIFKNYGTIICQKIIKQDNEKLGKILKIHGCVTKPETIIITENDYKKFIIINKYLSAKILTYFAEYPIIAIGYSISDRNILSILETLTDSDLFGNENKHIAGNVWFFEFTRSNFNINEIHKKELILKNNKSLLINHVHIKSFKDLYNTIIDIKDYPYSLTTIASKLGLNHNRSVLKYITVIEKKDNIEVKKCKDYYMEYKYSGNKIGRYSEKFVDRIKVEI
jgi:hypothetical protein